MSAVRSAVEEDAAGIARVHVDTWRSAYEGLLPADLLLAQSVEERTAAWKRQLRDPAVAVWVAVAERAGSLGFVAVGPSRDDESHRRTGELYAIYLHPQAWGSGIGYSLLRVAVGALAADYDVATLWVLDGNSRARRFYERQGWTRDGAHREESRGAAALQEARYFRRLANDA